LIVDNRIHVRLNISHPSSPAQYGLGDDERKLGIAFKQIRFDVQRKYVSGAVIDFSRPEANKYLASGWSFPEKHFRWSEGNESLVRIPIENMSGRIRISFSAHPFVHRDLKRQRCSLS